MTSGVEPARKSNRPGFSAVVAAVAGLAGGVGGAWVGMRVAVALIEPVDTLDPSNLFGNAITIIGPLLALAVGALAGFVAGSVFTPVIVAAVLKWERWGRTLGLIVVLDVVAVPLSVWLMILADGVSSEMGTAALWAAAALLGGFVPGLARWLAVRKSA